MQSQWDDFERRLNAVCQIIKELEETILSADDMSVEKEDAHRRMGIMQSRKAYLTNQQSEAENWLIENEAPGWTST